MSGSGVDPVALRAARERAKLTQHELARRVGAAGGERVSRWELGTSEPRPDFIWRLSAVLDIGPSQLLQHPSDGPDLRWLRLVRGLTAVQVAQAADVSKETYLRWESGRWIRQPSAGTLARLAEVLHESVDTVADALQRGRAT